MFQGPKDHRGESPASSSLPPHPKCSGHGCSWHVLSFWGSWCFTHHVVLQPIPPLHLSSSLRSPSLPVTRREAWCLPWLVDSGGEGGAVDLCCQHGKGVVAAAGPQDNLISLIKIGHFWPPPQHSYLWGWCPAPPPLISVVTKPLKIASVAM